MKTKKNLLTLLREAKELGPYLIAGVVVVLLIVAISAQYMPTPKEIEPAAETLLIMSGRLQ